MLQQVSEPFGILEIGFASRNGFDMLRIDQQHFHLPFQNSKNWFPETARTFHGHMGHAQGFEEVSHPEEIRGHGTERSPLLLPLAFGVRSDGAHDRRSLMH